MPRTSLENAMRAFERIAPRLVHGERQTLSALPHAGERVSVPWREETVDVYVHRASAPHARCVFELHGGGFALGTALRDDALCEAFGDKSGACVIGIDYPKAPLYRYPAALDACAAVLRYVEDNAARFGVDPARFAVMGFSAGANLAAVLAAGRETRRLSIAAQLLYYPYLDLWTDEDEKTLYPADMPADQMRVFRGLYCAPEQWPLPDVSPALAADAAAGPPAFFDLPEFDALHAEGARYAQTLARAGTPVTVREEPRMHHGYVEDAYMPPEADLRMDVDKTLFAPDYRQAADAALAAGAAFLQAHIL